MIHHTVRIKPELYERLKKESIERDLSIYELVNRAIADFMPRLVPTKYLDNWIPK